MTIQRIDCESGYKNATITLGYEELRELANGLYELSRLDEERNPDFYKIHRDMSFLFSIVKHGCLNPLIIKKLQEYQQKLEESANAHVD